MTSQQAVNWALTGWKSSPYAKYEGANYGIDFDGLWGFQCKDFVQAYSYFLNTPFTNGDAITLWTVRQAGWQLEELPLAGDVHVMPFTSGGVTYGHTGVVVATVPGGFYSMDQNWFNSSLTVGSPPAKVYHNNKDAIGFLRNNKIGGYMFTPAQVNMLCAIAFNRQARDDEKSVYSSIPIDEVLQRIFDGQENTQLRTNAQSFIEGQSAVLDKTSVEDYIAKNLK